MSEQPNYRRMSPPPDKSPEEYTYVERRAELYDLIDQQGGYRNLDRSQRELGERYGVVHRTIQKDIERILEWEREHLGEHTETELSLVQGRGIQDYIEAAKQYRKAGQYEKAAECMSKAYELASNHLDDLQELGEKDKAPDKHEHAGPDGNPLNVTIRRERYDGEDDDSAESGEGENE